MAPRRRVYGMLLALWLAGCGGDEGDEDVSSEAASTSSGSAAQEAASVTVFDEPVEIEVSARLLGDRRLEVTGETNLPEASRLQVIVERELSGVRWRSRVEVEEGRFVAGPLGPGSGLPDGGYRLRVDLQESSVQPAAVRERIGAQGEHLAGPLVQESRHGLGKIATQSRRYLVGSEPRRASDRVEVLEVE
jgi:hypothetical protein